MGRLFYSLAEGKTNENIDIKELDKTLQKIKTTVKQYALLASDACEKYYNPMFMGIVELNNMHFGNAIREEINNSYSSFYHPNAEKILNNTEKLLNDLRQHQIKKFGKKADSHYERAIPRHRKEAQKDLLGLYVVIQSMNAEIFGLPVKNEGGKIEQLDGVTNYYKGVTKDRKLGVFQDAYETSIKLVLFYQNMKAFLKVVEICEDELAKYTKYNFLKRNIKSIQEKKSLYKHKKNLAKLTPDNYAKRNEYQLL